ICSAPRLERSELSGRAPPAAVARWLDRRSMQIRQRPRGIMEVYETGFRPPKQILELNGMSILRGYAFNQRFWAYAASPWTAVLSPFGADIRSYFRLGIFLIIFSNAAHFDSVSIATVRASAVRHFSASTAT